MFEQIWTDNFVDELISLLTNEGVLFSDGLQEKTLLEIEQALGVILPPDLRFFLSKALPIEFQERPAFPRWDRDIALEIRTSRKRIEDSFAFDIKTNSYWHSSYGIKPNNVSEAVEQALSCIRTWPPLVRVFGHRFMPTEPSTYGGPVISLWQPTDTVYYGSNIADYLIKEFHLSTPSQEIVSHEPREVPYWGGALGL